MMMQRTDDYPSLPALQVCSHLLFSYTGYVPVSRIVRFEPMDSANGLSHERFGGVLIHMYSTYNSLLASM